MDSVNDFFVQCAVENNIEKLGILLDLGVSVNSIAYSGRITAPSAVLGYVTRGKF